MEPSNNMPPGGTILPNASDSVSIHLSYIARDLVDIKKTQKENWDAIRGDLHDLKGVYITREEFNVYKTDMAELKEIFNTKLITKEEFEPVKKIVYGIVGLVLTTLVVAGLALILNK